MVSKQLSSMLQLLSALANLISNIIFSVKQPTKLQKFYGLGGKVHTFSGCRRCLLIHKQNKTKQSNVTSEKLLHKEAYRFFDGENGTHREIVIHHFKINLIQNIKIQTQLARKDLNNI
jgi:hypothetical protein